MSDSSGEPGMPTVLVVHDRGSLTPVDIVRACQGWCEPRFAILADNPPESGTLELLTALGGVETVDADASALSDAATASAGVITFSDRTLATTAALADRLALPFHSRQTAELLTDKGAQRLALRRAGLAPLAFQVIPTPADVPATCSAVTYPAIIKPARGSGARDTYRVNDRAEAESTTTALLRRELRPLILEELYRPDPPDDVDKANLISVETIYRQGRPHHLATSGRFPFAEPFRETGLFMPSTLSPDLVSEAEALATAAAVALGVTTGCLHTELLRTADGMRVVEVNGRLGGHVAWLVNRCSGFDLANYLFRLAVGAAGDDDPIMRPHGVAFRSLLAPPVGATRLLAVEGVESARSVRGVDSVQVWARPGDEVDWTNGTDASVGVVSGLEIGHNDLWPTIAHLHATLRLHWS